MLSHLSSNNTVPFLDSKYCSIILDSTPLKIYEHEIADKEAHLFLFLNNPQT